MTETKSPRTSAAADNTAQEQRGRPFVAGASGNPAGRPKGARSRLGEAFVSDILADWRAEGVAAIEAARERDPVAYLRVIASLLPKHLRLDGNAHSDLSDEELDAELERACAQLVAEGYLRKREDSAEGLH